jgi:5-methylcytosine-specific restriction endonuclease McrA
MQTIDMKVCIDCQLQFPATLKYFHKSGKYLISYCKPCSSLRSKAWYQVNAEKAKAATKAWRQANLDKSKTTQKTYYQANPDKVNAKARKRNALKKGNNHIPYTEQQVLNTYGSNCYLCDMPIDFNATRQVGQPGWRSGLHIEHFIALSNGGADTLENTRPSHGWCNLSKGVASAY